MDCLAVGFDVFGGLLTTDKKGKWHLCTIRSAEANEPKEREKERKRCRWTK
jgi:predicted RNA-binding protein with RPS1 domain